uniref:PB1 domain-containing protein n=1 Tax=Chenopodium quinoa TaxID=63459 RepID=A0A803M753_CHEQI
MTRPSLEPPLSPKSSIKFLCSYGGKILPRYPDGKLRYNGGHTRVLAVPPSISFSELMKKMGELCGESVSLRCQLPTEDLDALVSIKSDEDLANLIEEYDPSLKLLSPKSLSPSSSFSAAGSSPRVASPRVVPPVMAYPVRYAQSANRNCHHCCRNSSHVYLIHNGNHWQ